MKIIALEPYYGGSHRAFLDGWIASSKHQWTILGLPAHKWKWRMRHAAISLAEQVESLPGNELPFDLLFCSDMLNLTEFVGLTRLPFNNLPLIAYFHENQLTYPVRDESERDLHFGMTNFTTAIAATEVWFNTVFHRDSFLNALKRMLRNMPDYNCLDHVDQIRAKSQVLPQGIEPIPERKERLPGPPRLLWVARWEFDKNPEMFFEALFHLAETGEEFQVDVVGQHFDTVPEIFEQARSRLGDRIVRWGYQTSQEEYVNALSQADIVVSTADHEFFGVSIVEAVSAGAFPLLPERLSYPELFGLGVRPEARDFFYDGSLDSLVGRLRELMDRTCQGRLWEDDSIGRRIVEPFYWNNLIPRLDDAAERVAQCEGQ